MDKDKNVNKRKKQRSDMAKKRNTQRPRSSKRLSNKNANPRNRATRRIQKSKRRSNNQSPIIFIAIGGVVVLMAVIIFAFSGSNKDLDDAQFKRIDFSNEKQ